MNIDSIRMEYTLGSLDIDTIDHDPFQFFRKWLNEAITSELPEPTAMSVSTIGADGFPQSRIVLLKSFDDSGYTFYTNYLSQKGQSMEINHRAALLFFWPELQRQVRITGIVTKVSRENTESYFATRPRSSQVGAWASEQSKALPSREYLEKLFRDIEARYEGSEIPAPDHWGGYLVTPHRFEFWQGRRSRLHDRFLFEREGDSWAVRRLAP
jgi:pyridoxamine 5'-phosphate oxidase